MNFDLFGPRHSPMMSSGQLTSSEKPIFIPAHATAVTYSPNGKVLAVGSDDSSVRVYHPPETKVKFALRGLGDSVSNLIFNDPEGSDLWVASGKSILRFDFKGPKLIYNSSDSILTEVIGSDDEDVINQLALSANRSYLAVTTDSGGVFVLDTSSENVSITKMKTSHDSIAWAVAFVPDRSSELVTSGYDCSLLLHDFRLGTLLARLEFTSLPALAPGISSLPPFITAIALSSNGIIASGTADGRIWIGFGGAKISPSTSGSNKKGKAKKTRKWGGLDEGEGFHTRISDSLIAEIKFISNDSLLACTVHGKLSKHHVVYPSSSSIPISSGGLQEEWNYQLNSFTRIDALAFNYIESQVSIAGLHTDQKRGVVELRSLFSSSSPTVETTEKTVDDKRT